MGHIPTYSDPFSLAVLPSRAGLAWSPLLDRLLRHAEGYVWPISPYRRTDHDLTHLYHNIQCMQCKPCKRLGICGMWYNIELYLHTLGFKMYVHTSMVFRHFYTPPQKVAGYYVIPSELLSVCPSVCPSVRPSVSG